jgi:hypothetical protein
MTCSRGACVLLLGAAGLLLAAGPAGAEDPAAEKPTVRKTKEQLHFELPPDWPVEKRGGIVAPIPVEEYLAKKFKSLEAQLQAIEQRLNGLDLRMRVLEEAAKSKTPQQGLRSTGGAQP